MKRTITSKLTFKILYALLMGVLYVFCFSANAAEWNVKNIEVDGVVWQVHWSDSHAYARPLDRGDSKTVIYEEFVEDTVELEPVEDDEIYSQNCYREFAGNILSIVGHYVSYKEYNFAMCDGMPHSFAYSNFGTIDIRNGEKINLLDLFDEKIVYEALLADPFMKKSLGDAKPMNLDELMKSANGGCDANIEMDALYSFAFHHLNKTSVAVRIGFSHGCEFTRGSLTQVGIYLPIPSGMREAFRLANKEGRLMLKLQKTNY